MSKKDVLDTVDIFFGAGKQSEEETSEKKSSAEIRKEIADEIARLEAELPALQAEAKRIAAARMKNTKAKAEKAAPARSSSRTADTSADAGEQPSYPPIAEPDLADTPTLPSSAQRGTHPYAGRMPQARQQQVQETPERERISFVLPAEQVEYLKNYKYCKALMDGDPQYTLTEALIEAIELLRKHSEYEVFERPDFVRAREKKPRR